MGGTTRRAPSSTEGVEQLKLEPGLIVQELGWDDDVDEDLRADIMDAIDGDLVEDSVEAVDVVLLWQRNDTDVADSLVDAMRDMGDNGYIWLFTPKIGRPGYVEPSELSEGAEVAGLTLTSAVDVADDWQATRVVRPHHGRR